MQKNLENYLINMTNKKYCLFVSRGATALYLIFKSIIYLRSKEVKIKKNVTKKIIIPATLCHSPANVAIISGLIPVFCDVNLNNYTLCPIDLKKKLISNEGVIAVLVSGTFGYLPKMKEIDEICKEHGVYLIDDSAQSFGVIVENKAMGSWGEVGIFSFGHTKTIDAGGGAALLTNNFELFNFCNSLYNSLDFKNAATEKLQNSYSSIYYEIEKKTKEDLNFNKLFWNFPEIFENIYCYKLSENNFLIKKILNDLNNLDNIINQRRSNFSIYFEQLKNVKQLFLPINENKIVPWRFTFRVIDSKRDQLVEKLRSKKIHVSTWYPSLEVRYKNEYPLYDIKCPNSRTLTNQIVNLWVDPNIVDLNTINLTCNLIEEILT
jgi:dTDP-4-amino-4,6-dideoxygalactose transaminase